MINMFSQGTYISYKKIMKKILMMFALIGGFTFLGSDINAGNYWVNNDYYFQHNAMTYNAKNNRVQNVWMSSGIKSNSAWSSAFSDGFNSYENKDSSGTNARSFNLNVVSTTNTNISNVDVYLVDDKNKRDVLGWVVGCVIDKNNKHVCKTEYISNANVHYYKLYINRYAHDTIIKNVDQRKKEARLTSAHEFSHTLAMGHYMTKNGNISMSVNSIMSYADSTKMNHALKTNDIKRLTNLYGK